MSSPCNATAVVTTGYFTIS